MPFGSNPAPACNGAAEVAADPAPEQKKDLYASDSPLQLDGNERQQIISYVLLRLDSELSKGQASYNYPIITVEHVLPQTPEANSVWMTWFPTEDMRQQYTHKLGNLVLLARKKNSQAQNYDFDLKKQKYFSTAKGVSPFALTTMVLTEKQWTPGVLDARQNRLVNALKTLWNLEPNRPSLVRFLYMVLFCD